ncbi:membrane protein insertase YidC [Tahibacter soli]|jgi:YidC/Oxa1 family membrane protein insertase|uniref:Membrane protein insertase YidC n=1 Tax=Tahibacter soli TaxID=2983605 RepID=A0A9X4BKI3_9GAMM|nr:membrane protein insertase YidC [Tahibacter soli]MDC8014292.1 membrane protein insertase YidC [Tahibacter soli]
MNNPRSFLLLALLTVSFFIWNQWQQDYSRPPVATTPATEAAPVPSDAPPASTTPAPGETPQASAAPAAAQPAAPSAASAPQGQLVEVSNDVLKLTIDTRGGSIVRADLLAYPQQPKDLTHPVRLFDDSAEHFFVAQSGLVSAQGTAPDHQALFTAEKTSYALDAGQAKLEVPLTWQDPASGLAVRKVFTLERGSYVLGTRQEIRNDGAVAWSGNAYRQLQRVPVVTKTGGMTFTNPESYSFAGAAWYSPEEKFKKIPFDKYTKDPLTNRAVTGGWVAMLQHYFFAAWLPPATDAEQFSTTQLTNGGRVRYLIRAMGPALTVAPGASATSEARLYVGPKLQSTLNDVAPGLALTIDYGILTVISEPLHWVLAKLHALTGNWGFAIILLVLLIKLAFFKLSEAQYRSMAKMRKLAPRVQALKDRYGDDRQKMNQAMMELYQKEKINPLGSCLPMLVQIPVFFALYWVLIESVELRHAPFILWIQNLTAPDPYFVLPIINAATMIATQYLTPTTGMDPVQAKMMKIMPVVFSVMFAFFPAGLVLYWTVNGLSSLIQQYVITKRIDAADAKA